MEEFLYCEKCHTAHRMDVRCMETKGGIMISIIGLVCALVLGFSTSASAVDSDALAKFLVKKGILTQADLQELEAELVKEQDARDERVRQIAGKASGVPDWVSRTTWKGDIRLRNVARASGGNSAAALGRASINPATSSAAAASVLAVELLSRE